jgi:hypothetical protein
MAQWPAAAAIQHGPVDLVPERLELTTDLGDERAEVGILAPRPHLADQQDPHAA